MARRNECLECKVFVGGLPNDASSEELEEAFSKYGRIKKVWLARRPPGFAFVEFEDSRDAEDAVKGLDGTRICGVRPRVEFSHGGSRRGGRGGGDSDPFLDAIIALPLDVLRCMTEKCFRVRNRKILRAINSIISWTPIRRRSLSRSRSPPPRRSPRYSRSRSRSLNRDN
ncbi:unnamed protein product [Onchocerca ochengi]|uniref:RRM domain-containing protein n=1 Tax=Onchocerca ochengi TaxID=42157 RepID=A0A182EK71_ONCOC|nr:unnamed protein product [Onchocerca ochengi]VDK89482.1 unnamed protein product [Onchocerca ochengi]